MRNIHVVSAISEEASGPSYSVARLCQSLIERGEETKLIALDWSKIKNPPDCLMVFQLGLGPRRLGFSPKMKCWLRNKALEGHIDIIHSHGLWMMPNIYAAWAARNTNCQLITSPRGTLSKWALSHSARKKKLFWTFCQKSALQLTTCFHATA